MTISAMEIAIAALQEFSAQSGCPVRLLVDNRNEHYVETQKEDVLVSVFIEGESIEAYEKDEWAMDVLLTPLTAANLVNKLLK